MKNILYFILCLWLFLLSSCNELTMGPEPLNNPQPNFEILWQEFDQMYALFEVKNVDWRAVYNQYATQVQPGTTDNELFELFSKMLGELNDGHVWLLKPGPDYGRFDSGTTFSSEGFSITVTKKYLEVVKELRSADGVNIVYGRMPGNVGYIFLEALGQSPSFYEKAMNEVVPYLADTKAIIVDARSLEGGDDRSAQHVAGRFASQSKVYITSRFRNGPRHSDFTSPLQWHVAPAGKSQ